jgi:ketosteroid isomerase-like protein
MTEPFDRFLTRREAASTDFINGRAKALLDLSTLHDPATFFPPDGKKIVGAAQVNASNAQGSMTFAPGGTGWFDILQIAASGDLGFWTGVQHARVRLGDTAAPVSMRLRATEVFRREADGWKLIHRHADMLADDSD